MNPATLNKVGAATTYFRNNLGIPNNSSNNSNNNNYNSSNLGGPPISNVQTSQLSATMNTANMMSTPMGTTATGMSPSLPPQQSNTRIPNMQMQSFNNPNVNVNNNNNNNNTNIPANMSMNMKQPPNKYGGGNTKPSLGRAASPPLSGPTQQTTTQGPANHNQAIHPQNASNMQYGAFRSNLQSKGSGGAGGTGAGAGGRPSSNWTPSGNIHSSNATLSRNTSMPMPNGANNAATASIDVHLARKWREKFAKNSNVYKRLSEFEQLVDRTLLKKHKSLKDAAQSKQELTRITFRLYITSTMAHQEEEGPDVVVLPHGIERTPMWNLRVFGRVMPSESESESAKSLTRFSQCFSRLIVELDSSMFPDNYLVEWNRSSEDRGIDGIEINRPGNKDCAVKIFVFPDFQCEKFLITEPIQKIMGVKVPYATKQQAINAVLNYVEEKSLLTGTTPPMLRIDETVRKLLRVAPSSWIEALAQDDQQQYKAQDDAETREPAGASTENAASGSETGGADSKPTRKQDTEEAVERITRSRSETEMESKNDKSSQVDRTVSINSVHTIRLDRLIECLRFHFSPLDPIEVPFVVRMHPKAHEECIKCVDIDLDMVMDSKDSTNDLNQRFGGALPHHPEFQAVNAKHLEAIETLVSHKMKHDLLLKFSESPQLTLCDMILHPDRYDMKSIDDSTVPPGLNGKFTNEVAVFRQNWVYEAAPRYVLKRTIKELEALEQKAAQEKPVTDPQPF
eukprot:CAMPEP_0184698408 /NCGR_PEP_ID=MMETSP0313-20130426/5050_1 /TAXON_ID=2792 /ORGANISM="Porphyridium aerugineum, Strain SAG 1380-2" /LENGTH=737 /DNA_ID=CAMNT_0027157353 /DNA_START=211 /DNA_END=2424 /DNA_ORIENTATION=+